MNEEKSRCPWAETLPIYIKYHDQEWGRPEHDDRKLFEMLVLEGMQSGLSWITILKKRAAFRAAFDGFAPEKIAFYDDRKIAQLLSNPSIIRNRRKIESAISNAKAFLEMEQKYGSFDQMIWRYVDNTPIIGHYEHFEEVPASTPLSEQISRDLKKNGFCFVGPTIIYSFMQAIGMVNDHLKSCFVYLELAPPEK